ncbi:hypothetical protein CMK19_10400 [Candidatus Poribacteria bacterium]|nr:hypothetical protein [Candidatus Poribacteria bacterium]MEE2909748.1 DUF1295 domain-containing protein [Candidatus Poribacteria bacterium]
MRDILGSVVSVAVAIVFAWAGAQNGPTILGFPALLFIVSIGFLIHWVIFIPSYLMRTEKFYDITGTIAYLAMISTSVYVVSSTAGALAFRSKVVVVMVIVWAMRLGLFLFIRVLKVGEDSRFEDAKNSFVTFLMFFNISGLWVFLTTANALTLILNNSDLFGDFQFFVGLTIWIIGFSFEVIADEQKRRFRKKTENQGMFIVSGLWSISRHPNYFGEILIWTGMAIISLPVLSGWQYATLISPIFVTLLLTRISGVNLLEESADKKWGHLDNYQDYKKNTAVLVPFIF